jgi:hypothetical protein
MCTEPIEKERSRGFVVMEVLETPQPSLMFLSHRSNDMSFISRTLALTGAALLVLAQDAFAGCMPLWSSARGSSSPYLSPAAVADYDGDGIDDLVAARSTDVTVFLTNPATTALGTFVSLQTGASGISSIATADFDGNGHKDVVVGSVTNASFTIFRSNGDGTFAPPATIATSVNPTEIVTGDFNGDGNVDVAARNDNLSALLVWAGDGRGGFSEQSRVSAPAAVNVPLVGDWNKDGKLDILMLSADKRNLQMFRGNGDGTFMSRVAVALTFAADKYATGDFDGDGDLDVALSKVNTSGLTVLQNDGTGSFPTYDEYGSVPSTGNYRGDVQSVAAGDVTQDGIDDILITQYSGSFVGTYVGRRNATLEAPYFARMSAVNSFTVNVLPARVLLGRFNADAKTDLLYMAYSNGSAIALNNCGETSLTASALTPVITTGSAAMLSLSIRRAGYVLLIPVPPAPSGTLSIYEDTTLVETMNVGDAAEYELRGLTPGNHVLHAVYDGDDRYDAARSSTFEVRVTNEATTTSLTSDKAVYSFGETITLQAVAKSADGAALSGNFRFIFDGVPQPGYYSHRTDWRAAPGEHRYQVQYLGDGTHPASISPLVTVRVDRAATKIELWDSPGGITRFGETEKRSFLTTVLPNGQTTGTVELYDGLTKIASAPSHAPEFYLSLTVGSHTLTAKYLGDTRYAPSELVFRHVVVPNQPVALDATAMNGAIELNWIAPADSRSVLQRLVHGGWTDVPRSTTYNFHAERNATPATAYIYRVQAYDAANVLIGTSNTDVAMLTAFSDDPAVRGMTRIKAAHFAELAGATNTLRAAANLPPIRLQNAASGQRITSANLLALRNGIQDARVLLGAGGYSFSNPGTPGTAARAVDIDELRNALR